jgi:tetratricopeptide (TPR) repeat protein
LGARAATDEWAAMLNAANELARAGKLEAAESAYEDLLKSHGDFAEAHANLGELRLQRGRFAEAAASAARALAVKPDFAPAHHTLGNALLRLHRLEEALASFSRAVALDPGYLDAHMNRAAALRSAGRLAAAAESLQCALQINPRLAAAHVGLATVYRLQRRVEDCERSCETALKLERDSAAALEVLTELRADLGAFSQAEALHRRILAADPDALESVAALVRLKRMSAADGDWLNMAQQLLAKGWPARRERLLHYALAKYFDDVAEFERAFCHYRRANELSKEFGPPYDPQALARTVDAILRVQDRSWIARKQCKSNASDRPVFVVGMLRSGTTLMEQILASHPAVFGAGEQSFWGDECAAAFAQAAATLSTLEFSDAELARLGAGYLDLLNGLPSDAPRIIDKFPANFFFLGLIHAALPQARFIHMQRDPKDTCLSIYFHQFEAVNAYANDLGSLAHYYGEYRRLMRHWRALLPREVLLEVPYQGLVEQPEEWSRTLLKFIELPWDARCLDFEHTARSVVTASRWQVRQGILKSSLNRWRNYAAHLGPLAALNPE